MTNKKNFDSLNKEHRRILKSKNATIFKNATSQYRNIK